MHAPVRTYTVLHKPICPWVAVARLLSAIGCRLGAQLDAVPVTTLLHIMPHQGRSA